ncbi:TolC family protein [Gammaproteobacteria bacterium]|nr:TolC family protein [Gammaproteobacteria bacterium]
MIKQLRIRVLAACLFLCPFFGVAADSEQTSTPWPGSLEALLQSALEEHPLVDAGRAEIRSAEQGIKSARWQFFPTPGVEYQQAYADDADRNFQGDDYTAVFSLEQPLWSGGRISGGLASARAALGVSQASLQENQRELALRVVQAYGEWLTASLQKDTLETSEQRHLKLFERVRRRIEGGVSTGSDL